MTAGMKASNDALAGPSTPRSLPDDKTLKLAASKQLKRSTVHPDFVKSYAATNGNDKNANIEFITGAAATRMYNNYLSDVDAAENRGQAQLDRSHSMANSNIVFAFPTKVAGKKVTDFFMPWKARPARAPEGVPTAKPLKGSMRKQDFLNSEFKKFRQGLTQEYKRLSQFTDAEELPSTVRLPATPATLASQLVAQTPAAAQAAVLAPTTADNTANVEGATLKPPPPIRIDGIGHQAPSLISSGSVQSLPCLEMAHRKRYEPLVITNPDLQLSPPVSPADSLLPRLDVRQPVHVQTLPVHPEEVVGVPVLERVPSDGSSGSRENGNKAKKQKTRHSVEFLDPHQKKENLVHGPSKKDSKLFVVLLDEAPKAWHGNEPGAATAATTLLSRKASTQRRSAWDGPPVHVNGSFHKNGPNKALQRTPSRTRRNSLRNSTSPKFGLYDSLPVDDDFSDSESDDDDSWDQGPAVPTRTLLASFGYAPSTPEHFMQPLYNPSAASSPAYPFYSTAPATSPFIPQQLLSPANSFAAQNMYASSVATATPQMGVAGPFACSSVFGTPPGFVPQSIQSTPAQLSVPMPGMPNPGHWAPVMSPMEQVLGYSGPYTSSTPRSGHRSVY